jgi:hypothetical protein
MSTIFSTYDKIQLNQNNNNKQDIINIIKNLEKENTSKVLFIGYDLGTTAFTNTIDSTIFTNPKYILYRSNINFSTNIHPSSGTSLTPLIPVANNYALKIYGYITINTSDTYTISNTETSDSLKLYINGYLILDSSISTTPINTADIYLKEGNYLIYIEKKAKKNDNKLNINLNLASSQSKTLTIDNYITDSSPRYTLFKNLVDSRDSSIRNYCNPNNNKNIFNDNNICRDYSISTTDDYILNNTINNFCFGETNKEKPNLISGKLNTDCKNYYSINNLNSKIKDDGISRYDKWANFLTTINNNNKDALEEYISWRKPPTDKFTNFTLVQTYCETSEKNNYNISDSLCKAVYDTYKDKTKDSLITIRTNYCFPNNSIKKSQDGKFDSLCTSGIASTSKDVAKSILETEYAKWATSTINKQNTNFENEDIILNEYINSSYFNSSGNKLERLFGENVKAPTNLTNYCETKIGDKFIADNNKNNLCNSLYNDNIINKDTNIESSINKIKTNYCIKQIDGKPRYETDPLCSPLIKNDSLLNNTIRTRCLPSGKFTGSDNYCTTLSDNNINNDDKLFTDLNTGRTKLLSEEINKILPTQTNKKILTDHSLNYAIGKYNDYNSKKLSNELLTQKLFDYCEQMEPNYPTDKDSQCKAIYDKFKDNTSIKSSREKMRDSLCQDKGTSAIPYPNILTENDPSKTNIYKCKSTIFNTNNLNKFNDTIKNYCGSNENITSTECKEYYKDIENKVLQNLNLAIKPEPILTSTAFTNKNSDSDLHQYQNIVLESYQNNMNDLVNNNQETEFNSDDIVPIILSDDKIDIVEEEYNMILYLFLWIIFLLLISTLLYSCIYKKSKSNIMNQNI